MNRLLKVKIWFSGYEIRKAVDEKGDGVYATKEFKGKTATFSEKINHYSAGETIFDEVPAVLCPHDRRFCCFHCCKPIESINQAVQRMAKDPKLKFFQIIPTEKKPEIIIDDITKAGFLSHSLDYKCILSCIFDMKSDDKNPWKVKILLCGML